MKIALRAAVVNTVLIRQMKQLGGMTGDTVYITLYIESSFHIRFKDKNPIILFLKRTLELIYPSQFTLGDTKAPQRIK